MLLIASIVSFFYPDRLRAEAEAARDARAQAAADADAQRHRAAELEDALARAQKEGGDARRSVKEALAHVAKVERERKAEARPPS